VLCYGGAFAFGLDIWSAVNDSSALASIGYVLAIVGQLVYQPQRRSKSLTTVQVPEPGRKKL
jgi:hypothetical protein